MCLSFRDAFKKLGQWIGASLCALVSKIPVLQCVTGFSAGTHLIALKKFAFLLIFTSLPIIVTAMLSPIPDGDLGFMSKLVDKLNESVSASELFVYSASFLTPILYLIYEVYKEYPSGELSERLSKGIRGAFKGHGLVATLSLLTLVFTAIGFSMIKTKAPGFESSFLYYLMTSYAFLVYLFSLYCWYLTLLVEVGRDDDYVQASRKSENDLSQSFADRLHGKGNPK